MNTEQEITNNGASPIRIIHMKTVLRKIFLILQFGLGLTVLTMGILLWLGSMDFKNLAHFLALLSLLTGFIIFTSCTSPGIIAMKKFFGFVGIAGFICGIGCSLVFWQFLPVEYWYYFNLILVIGICLSLFSETEKVRLENKNSGEEQKKIRSVIHVVASIILLITLACMLFHVLGWVDLKLPLLILIGAVFLLVMAVVVKNRKSHNL